METLVQERPPGSHAGATSPKGQAREGNGRRALGPAGLFPKSLLASASLHAAALGCAMVFAHGAPPHGGSPAPRAAFVRVEPRAEVEPWEAQAEPEQAIQAEALPPEEIRPVEVAEERAPYAEDPELTPPADPSARLARLANLPLLRVEPKPPAEPVATPAAEPPVAIPATAAAAPQAPDEPSPRADGEAVLIHGPSPEYPRLSLRLGEEGSVLLRLWVAADGAVARAEVAESSGFRRLDEAALQAVLAWRFDPALRAGVAAGSSVLHRVTFRIGDGKD